jgi:hypothetical protein
MRIAGSGTNASVAKGGFCLGAARSGASLVVKAGLTRSALLKQSED